MNKLKDESTLEGMMVVKDYPDIFPEELSTLSPLRDVEFAIALEPGTCF
jgi:hypothetical protein